VAVDELEPAAIAYAALEQIEKVRFIEKARATPNGARRAADLAAFKREPEEAERILLGAGLVFRAIELNLRLFDWDRALEIALEHKTHIDTVLCFRAAYLKRNKRREDKKDFVAAAREVEVSEEQVRAKIAREREREKALPAREETARAGAKDRNRAAPKAKPSAAKAPAGARTGSTRR
jgi:intraflagellar transport protein 80